MANFKGLRKNVSTFCKVVGCKALEVLSDLLCICTGDCKEPCVAELSTVKTFTTVMELLDSQHGSEQRKPKSRRFEKSGVW